MVPKRHFLDLSFWHITTKTSPKKQPYQGQITFRKSNGKSDLCNAIFLKDKMLPKKLYYEEIKKMLLKLILDLVICPSRALSLSYVFWFGHFPRSKINSEIIFLNLVFYNYYFRLNLIYSSQNGVNFFYFLLYLKKKHELTLVWVFLSRKKILKEAKTQEYG